MSRPRVFVSSTYYDLKYVRSSLEVFIESLGYDPILSEKGDIAYTPEIPLDESCYREVQNSDIYVLIIGGRYGSAVSSTQSDTSKGFFDHYESITKMEYKSAAEKDIPIYILIEKSVHAEYYTFLRNRENNKINYAHVDSANIFQFIEEILSQPRNNPVHTFDRYSEIEGWLREQWAGLFREFINRMSSQQQIKSLSAQVADLADISKTLKRYLEEVVSKVAPDQASTLINSEGERLKESKHLAIIEENPFFMILNDRLSIGFDEIYQDLIRSDGFNMFAEELYTRNDAPQKFDLRRFILNDKEVQSMINATRSQIGLPPYKINPLA